MKIVITYNKPGKNALEDELDILDEVALVSACLKELGHEVIKLPMTLNLEKAFLFLKNEKPDLIFNLVESLQNYGAIVFFPPALFDILQIPYTGNPTVPMFFTAGKTITKQALFNAGLPVTASYKPSEVADLPNGKYILKPLWEEGSLGLDEASVFEITGLDNINLNSFANDLYFIEPYIDGREFNVSLLAINSEPVVLAVAEILFVDYPSDKPKVLGYRAKWNEESFEFKNTVRTYDLGKNGNQIHKLLSDISLKCWKTLGLKGYARVDFIMDNSGNPFILEVNANPCITPGSGFYAACEYAGYSFTQVVDKIIKEVLK